MPPKDPKSRKLPKGHPRFPHPDFYSHGGLTVVDGQDVDSKESAELAESMLTKEQIEENKKQWKKDKEKWLRTDPRVLAFRAKNPDAYEPAAPIKKRGRDGKAKGKRAKKASSDEDDDDTESDGEEEAQSTSAALGGASSSKAKKVDSEAPVASEQPKEKKSHVVLIVDGDEDEVKKEKGVVPDPIETAQEMQATLRSRGVGGFFAPSAPEPPAKKQPKQAPETLKEQVPEPPAKKQPKQAPETLKEQVPEPPAKEQQASPSKEEHSSFCAAVHVFATLNMLMAKEDATMLAFGPKPYSNEVSVHASKVFRAFLDHGVNPFDPVCKMCDAYTKNECLYHRKGAGFLDGVRASLDKAKANMAKTAN